MKNKPSTGRPRKTLRDDQKQFDAQTAAALRQGKSWSAWARLVLRLASGTGKERNVR